MRKERMQYRTIAIYLRFPAAPDASAVDRLFRELVDNVKINGIDEDLLAQVAALGGECEFRTDAWGQGEEEHGVRHRQVLPDA